MADIIFPGEVPLDTLGATRLPGNMDLSIWRGDAQEFIIKLEGSDGTPISLSEYTAQATIRQSFNAPTKYEFTCTISGVNEVTVYMSSPTSKSIPAGDYVWNFQLTAPNGDVRTYLAGDVTVYAEVD